MSRRQSTRSTGGGWTNPTQEETRDEFLKDQQTPKYGVSLRLNQTHIVSGQVRTRELAEFIGAVSQMAASRFDIPTEYLDVSDGTAQLTLCERFLYGVDDREFEREVESLAEEYDIALCKSISMKRGDVPGTFDGGVFVKYLFGWNPGGENIEDPEYPLARVEWVGGERGRPETMKKPDPVTTEHTDIPQKRGFLTRIRETVTSLL